MAPSGAVSDFRDLSDGLSFRSCRSRPPAEGGVSASGGGACRAIFVSLRISAGSGGRCCAVLPFAPNSADFRISACARWPFPSSCAMRKNALAESAFPLPAMPRRMPPAGPPPSAGRYGRGFRHPPKPLSAPGNSGLLLRTASRPSACSTVFRRSHFSVGAHGIPSVCGVVPFRSAPVRMSVPRSFAALTSPPVHSASRPSAAPCRLGPLPSGCLFHGLLQVLLLRRCARHPVRLRRRAVSVRSRPDVCSTVFRSSYFSAGALRVPSVCGAVPSRSAPVRMPVPRSFAGLTSPSVRTASRPSAASCRFGPLPSGCLFHGLSQVSLLRRCTPRPVRLPVPQSFTGLTSPSVRTASRPSAAPCRLGPHAGSAEATGRR